MTATTDTSRKEIAACDATLTQLRLERRACKDTAQWLELTKQINSWLETRFHVTNGKEV